MATRHHAYKRTSQLKPVGRLWGGKARRWIVPVHYTPNL